MKLIITKMTKSEFDVLMKLLLPDPFTCLYVEDIIGVKNMEELLIASEADALFVEPMVWPGENPLPVRNLDATPIVTKLSRNANLKNIFLVVYSKNLQLRIWTKHV